MTYVLVKYKEGSYINPIAKHENVCHVQTIDDYGTLKYLIEWVETEPVNIRRSIQYDAQEVDISIW